MRLPRRAANGPVKQPFTVNGKLPRPPKKASEQKIHELDHKSNTIIIPNSEAAVLLHVLGAKDIGNVEKHTSAIHFRMFELPDNISFEGRYARHEEYSDHAWVPFTVSAPDGTILFTVISDEATIIGSTWVSTLPAARLLPDGTILPDEIVYAGKAFDTDISGAERLFYSGVTSAGIYSYLDRVKQNIATNDFVLKYFIDSKFARDRFAYAFELDIDSDGFEVYFNLYLENGELAEDIRAFKSSPEFETILEKVIAVTKEKYEDLDTHRQALTLALVEQLTPAVETTIDLTAPVIGIQQIA